jgi:peptidoglycan/LPS O-acetylase OafA/YrhL
MLHQQIDTQVEVGDTTLVLLGTPTLLEPVRALTALRGLAAWWVVTFHFREALPLGTPGPLRAAAGHGYLAVDLFFVLSGYVIALNYASWFRANPTPRDYARFLLLRLSRVYPLHAAVLVLFLINPLAVTVFSHHSVLSAPRWGYFGLSVLLMQSWGFTAGPAWNVPAWSISTEWFAYLCFPFIAVFGLFAAGSARRACLTLGGIVGLIAVVAGTVSPSGLGFGNQGFEMFRCLAEFMLGTMIVHFERKVAHLRWRSTIALTFAVCCFAVTALCPIPDYVLIPAGFAAIVYALTDEELFLSRWLHGRTLQWLGLVSYSTYLCHYLLKIWIKFVLVRPAVPSALVFPLYSLVVLAASAILYRSVERPAQRWCRTRLRAAGLI